ncbi:A-Kinase Anchoring Protein 17A [Anaeramoeba flamelloides]|uniref:A-Kinase Anchoring Protein 17A n=1 Tax=Anaeramoeba flamelloides TaxID=1746091 RepID=A0AAV8ABC8_9EUKA|nr:A-Kinase Anchoring Protein 17A [Anaeramoeba flamelloides]
MSVEHKPFVTSVQFQFNKSKPDVGEFSLKSNRLQIRNKTKLLDFFLAPHQTVTHNVQSFGVTLNLSSTSFLIFTCEKQKNSKELYLMIKQQISGIKRSLNKFKASRQMDRASKAKQLNQELRDQEGYQEEMKSKYRSALKDSKLGLFIADYSFSGGDFIIDNSIKVTAKKLIFSQEQQQQTVFVLRPTTKILDKNDSECIVQIFEGVYITIIFKHKVICDTFIKILNKRLKYIKSVSSFQNSYIVQEFSIELKPLKKYKLKILHNRISIRSKQIPVINIPFDNEINLKYNSQFPTQLIIQPKDYNARLFKFTKPIERDRFLEIYFFSNQDYLQKKSKKEQKRKEKLQDKEKQRKKIEKEIEKKKKIQQIEKEKEIKEKDKEIEKEKEKNMEEEMEIENERKRGKEKEKEKKKDNGKEKEIKKKEKTSKSNKKSKSFKVEISEIGKITQDLKLIDALKANLMIDREAIKIVREDKLKTNFKLDEIIVETSDKIAKIEFLDKKREGNLYIQFKSVEETNKFFKIINYFLLK